MKNKKIKKKISENSPRSALKVKKPKPTQQKMKGQNVSRGKQKEISKRLTRKSAQKLESQIDDDKTSEQYTTEEDQNEQQQTESNNSSDDGDSQRSEGSSQEQTNSQYDSESSDQEENVEDEDNSQDEQEEIEEDSQSNSESGEEDNESEVEEDSQQDQRETDEEQDSNSEEVSENISQTVDSEQVEQNTDENSSIQSSNQQSQNSNSISEEDVASESESNEENTKQSYRRKSKQIPKQFQCLIKKCGKLYGSYQALYTHLKMKHINLGSKRIYNLADKEKQRIIQLQEERDNEEVSEEQTEGDDNTEQDESGNQSETSGSENEQSDQQTNSEEESSESNQSTDQQNSDQEDDESDGQEEQASLKKRQTKIKKDSKQKVIEKNKKESNSGKNRKNSNKIEIEETEQSESNEDSQSEENQQDNISQLKILKKLQKEKENDLKKNNSKKVKEIYDQQYMHLIKPGLVNKKQIKKLMKNQEISEEQTEDEQEQEQLINKKQKNKQTNSKENIKSKLNGTKNNEDSDDDQKKGPGRPKKKKNVFAIRRTYSSVEQMIQKSINKQLALAEIKKQQRNLKLQKIDKKKLNELNVFQPSYLFDLVKEIQLSYQELGNDENNQIITKNLNELIFQYDNKNNNSNDNNNQSKQPKKGKKSVKQIEIVQDYVDDYPIIDQNNSFLLEPLQKQLIYVKNLDRELGNEEIQGIGLRLAYSLKHLSQYVSKPFYQEMVYFMGYILRVLSIKKAVSYQEVLQDFLSIYEYMMNSIQYGGFVENFPILSQFTDVSKVYSFPKNIILSIFKIIFKSNNAYSQNLQQQYYYYNQAQNSSF